MKSCPYNYSILIFLVDNPCYAMPPYVIPKPKLVLYIDLFIIHERSHSMLPFGLRTRKTSCSPSAGNFSQDPSSFFSGFKKSR